MVELNIAKRELAFWKLIKHFIELLKILSTFYSSWNVESRIEIQSSPALIHVTFGIITNNNDVNLINHKSTEALFEFHHINSSYLYAYFISNLNKTKILSISSILVF